MSTLRSDCPAEDGAWTGSQAYGRKQLVYNLLDTSGVADIWAQPDTYVRLLAPQSPSNDPSVANVVLHSVACVRELPGGAPGLVTVGSLATEALRGPIATIVDPAAPLTPPLARDQFTTGRGAGVPQFRIKFKDGSTDGQVVFVDGGCSLSLPGGEVEIDAFVSSRDLLINPAPNSTIVLRGLFVEAFVEPSVSWSSREGVGGAPSGRATYTQTQLVTLNGGVPPIPNTLYFERPPFARQVRVVPAVGQLAGGVSLLTSRFVSGGTFDLGTLASGLAIGAQYSLSPADHTIPSATTHIEVIPRPGVAAGSPVSVVWGIGD